MTNSTNSLQFTLPLLNKKKNKIKYTYLLCLYPYIRFCSNPAFHIRNKALVVDAILDVFLVRVPGNCWTDAEYWLGYRTWRGKKSRDENFWDCAVFCHVWWFAWSCPSFSLFLFHFLINSMVSSDCDILIQVFIPHDQIILYVRVF